MPDDVIEDDLPDPDDPFVGLDDEDELSPERTRDLLLTRAKRGYMPLRKVFVQKPNTETSRSSVLADLVHNKQERALDAFQLLHAMQPILNGTPLPMSTWASMLSTPRSTCTPNQASRAFGTLAEMNLVRRDRAGRQAVLEPLLEDGSGAPWIRPGATEEGGPGYFTVPHAYWTAGLMERLRLPGKAMMLIILAETQNPKKPTFDMAVERAQAWYGISERTAERGYLQLSAEKVMRVHIQKVADPRVPGGRRAIYHRALESPFSTRSRARLQKAARTAMETSTPGG
ncbi:MAG: hypothetical protein QOF58_1181 [Pseudonocardiales bacterium]|jgi:hypothetical protein|nr:hypothetical protein [Actinomycetota bacterium]MDT7782762.1 hypothetical protein [Pseudonocardiales bacterium]